MFFLIKRKYKQYVGKEEIILIILKHFDPAITISQKDTRFEKPRTCLS